MGESIRETLKIILAGDVPATVRWRADGPCEPDRRYERLERYARRLAELGVTADTLDAYLNSRKKWKRKG